MSHRNLRSQIAQLKVFTEKKYSQTAFRSKWKIEYVIDTNTYRKKQTLQIFVLEKNPQDWRR